MAARWDIKNSGQTLTVVHVDLATGERFPCGNARSDSATIDMCIEWVLGQADVGDLITINGEQVLSLMEPVHEVLPPRFYYQRVARA